MDTAMPIQQRGITFGGFLITAFLLVFVGIFGLKLIPAYMEEATIKSVFNSIAHDPEMKSATAKDIQTSFGKHASIDNIKSIKPDEVEIATEQGKLVLSASYFVKVPLAGNVSLYLDFNPTSTP
jgi:hypothetical protein